MCQCFGGEPVDFENLRSPEQQAMMQGLYHMILSGGQQGTTPFPGQLNAPMTDMQKMAAKTMSGIGGYGWEQQKPQYEPVPNMFNPTNTWNLPVRGDGESQTQTNPITPAVDPRVIGLINEILGGGGGGDRFRYDPGNHPRKKEDRKPQRK